MRKPVSLIIQLLLSANLLAACGVSSEPLPTLMTFPTDTPTATATRTPSGPTAIPTTTLAPTKTITPEPSSTPTLSHPATPPADWVPYINEALGYQFYYPAGARISEQGFTGLDPDEIIPAGMTSSDYEKFLKQALPKSLCVTVATQIPLRDRGDGDREYNDPSAGYYLGQVYQTLPGG